MSDRDFPPPGPASENFLGGRDARGESVGMAFSEGGFAFLSSFYNCVANLWERNALETPRALRICENWGREIGKAG